MQTFELIKEYYGQVLSSKNDLKTTACCSSESVPSYLKPLLAKVHEEVSSKFYGCGVPIPPHLSGCTVLDLGSGTGRDCFLLSSLVGDKGRVIGVDMTDEQLEIAKKHQSFHQKAYNLKNANVEFHKGYIEDLKSCDIADNSVDVVVSNCVINLSPDKERVFSEIFRVLKPGGELYFSDVYADRRLADKLKTDQVLLGECLAGAMYSEDFRRVLAKVGCADVRTVERSEITITNEDVKNKIGNTRFYSVTARAFKLPIEDRCEDYGQIAIYKGGIAEMRQGFFLDDHHYFEVGRPMAVCSNTADMVSKTRYANYFSITGDTSVHYGLFDCGPTPAVTSGAKVSAGSCC